MKFSLIPTIESNVITITITGLFPNQSELKQEAKFGSFIVDAGGDFPGPPAFIVPERQFNIRPSEDFVAEQKFFLTDDEDAQKKTNSYIITMTQRISNAKITFDQQTDITNASSFNA